MKSLILAIITLILVLLASYIAVSYEPAYILKTFTIEGNRENTETNHNNIQTFVIWQKPTGRSMLIETYRLTKNARQRNLLYQHRDEEIEKCIDKITKNWKRTYFRRSYEEVYDDEEEEWVTTNLFYEREREFWGYDEDEDFRLRWRLRNRALNGEKIC